jgi:hypothetical protein
VILLRILCGDWLSIRLRDWMSRSAPLPCMMRSSR